jgi:hypothetical protein
LAQRYETLQGINWDEVLLDGSKKPAKKGANRQAPAPWIAANAGRHCTYMPGPPRCGVGDEGI